MFSFPAGGSVTSPAAMTIKVACAVIERSGCILAAQRSESMSLPLKWEFPGGKIRAKESPEGCLVREIREELGIAIEVVASLPVSVYCYDTRSIELYPYVCRIVGGEVRLAEHKAVLWGPPADLLALDWAAADAPVLESYLRHRAT
jgi:8-oxo-dGTP diphosphatase